MQLVDRAPQSYKALVPWRGTGELLAIIDGMPTALVMTNVDGRIDLVNTQTERLFGHSRTELVGETVEILLPHRFRGAHPGLRASFQTDPRARPMGAGRDLFGLRKDGTEFPIEIGMNPIHAEDGVHVVSTIVDITERVRHAEALRRANEALERSNTDLQRFAYIASHDLQTPMRGIASFVDLLGATYADALDARGKDWIRRTSESVKQLQVLVQDLLEYSRVDTQSHPFERVSMREALDRAVSLLDASIRDSSAEITSGVLPDVMGDRSQLVQLLLNLVGNAIKYRGSHPARVHVSAAAREGELVFAVRDNGIGIAPKYFERIFEIFKRLHGSHEYPGSGIGLSICRRIVNRHGGRIWVESEPGQGSTFYFTMGGEARADD